MDISCVENFLEGLPEVQQAIDKRELRRFWTWEFAEIGDDQLSPENSFQEGLDERIAFVGEFRRQHDKVIKFLTERTLVRLTPLFDLISKNLEMADRFLRKGEPSPTEKLVRGVGDYLKNASNFIPLEEKVTFAAWNIKPPLLLCFTDDVHHKEEAFILVRGDLSNYFISFDILAKHYPEDLVEAYSQQVASFEKINGQPIEQLLFMVKKYGPVGPLRLAKLFKKNHHLKDKTFIKYSPFRKGMVDLFAEDRCLLRRPAGKVCTIYDLIFSGEGILQAKNFYHVMDNDYRVVVLFENPECPDRNELLKNIKHEELYPYEEVMDIIKKEKFISAWPGTAKQFATPQPSTEEDILNPQNWFRPLWDFVTGLGNDNIDTITCAGYIGQFLNVLLADDFQPYGRARIESESLSKKLYLLEKYFQKRKPLEDRKYAHQSLEYKVGSLFKGYEFEDICIASLLLAYNTQKQKLTEAELARGEEVVEEIKRKSHDAGLPSSFPQN